MNQQFGAEDKGEIPEAEIINMVNMEWLKESLNIIGWTDVGKWLMEHYGVSGASVEDMVKQLTHEQAQELVAEVEARFWKMV